VPADVADELAAFAAAANQNLRSKFLGTLLTYKKEAAAPSGGRFRYGENKMELALGTKLVAIMAEIRHGHIKWKAGKIVGESIHKVRDVPRLDRETLGDLDQDNWPVNEISGKRDDPWTHIVYVPMVGLDGETFYTFSAKSYYGRSAAYRLIDRYALLGRQHVGQYPIIELGSEIVPSKKYDGIPAPTLEIVGWTNRPALALTDESVEVAVEEQEEKPSPSFGADMNDEIPF